MRANEEMELGKRVARGLVMENRGRVEGRTWWVVSAAVVALASAERRGLGLS
jgi:hypothetical protein